MVQKIIFWQNIISILQSSFIRELASKSKYEVYLVVEEKISEDRRKLGWAEPCLGVAKLIVSPDDTTIVSIVKENKEAIHIFSGFRGYELVKKALDFCIVSGVEKIGVLSEPRKYINLKGKLRWIDSYFFEQKYRSKADFYLAIGTLAEKWFLSLNILENKVFPFCYFVEETDTNLGEADRFEVFKVFYVGQLIKRKGVDLLLKALKRVNTDYQNWELHLIGDGVERENLIEQCARLNILEKVHFHGVLRNSDLRVLLRRADLFVLPSRWDGWGAVINEALHAGLPVICSSYCGASEIVSLSPSGYIFESGSVTNLSLTLKKIISEGKTTVEKRNEIIEWSRKVTGAVGAAYFDQIIKHLYFDYTKPRAPWLSTQL